MHMRSGKYKVTTSFSAIGVGPFGGLINQECSRGNSKDGKTIPKVPSSLTVKEVQGTLGDCRSRKTPFKFFNFCNLPVFLHRQAIQLGNNALSASLDFCNLPAFLRFQTTRNNALSTFSTSATCHRSFTVSFITKFIPKCMPPLRRSRHIPRIQIYESENGLYVQA
jgi:hypothetical protein